MNMRQYIYIGISLIIGLQFWSCDILTPGATSPNDVNQAMRSFGTGENETGKYIINTADGGYLLAGTSIPSGERNGYYIVKTNEAGVMEWTQIWDNDDEEENDDVSMRKILTNDDNELFLLGTVNSNSHVPEIIYADKKGLIIDEISIPTNVSSNAIDFLELPDAKHFLILSDAVDASLMTVCLLDLETHEIHWSKEYKYDNASINAISLFDLTNGNFVISGTVTDHTTGISQILMLEIDENGGEVNVNFLANSVVVSDFSVLSNGDYLVLTNPCDDCYDGYKLYIVAQDLSTVQLLYQRENIFGNHVECLADNDIVVTGTELLSSEAEGITYSRYSIFAENIDEAGNLLWTNTFETPNNVATSRDNIAAGNSVRRKGSTSGYAIIGTYDFFTVTKMLLIQTDDQGNLK